MAEEIKRLNQILAESNQSFCKLYQSLLEKKKQLTALEAKLVEAKRDSESRVRQLEEKATKLIYDTSVLKVGLKY